MTAVPADTNFLTRLPVRHAGARFVDHTRDFVPRHTWVHKARPAAFLGEHIAVTDSARLHADPHVPGPGLRDLTLDDLEVRAGFRYLCHFHLRHRGLLRCAMRRVPAA